ncbi:MAG: hypothetical protein EDS66_16725 [Planctomycetota bacterium]|nr:MAG: hypothetical protein EDS66_16725 [Planctomycetota bacterium]MCQ3922574.1 hypothetical protein [Planctomycetota bacterium]
MSTTVASQAPDLRRFFAVAVWSSGPIRAIIETSVSGPIHATSPLRYDPPFRARRPVGTG